MTVGERIKRRRLELGMTQAELAEKVGFKSRSSINKIELAAQLPNQKIEEIAAALYTSPGYLMGWTDEPTNPPDLIVLTGKQRELLSVASVLSTKQVNNLIQYAEFLKGGGNNGR